MKHVRKLNENDYFNLRCLGYIFILEPFKIYSEISSGVSERAKNINYFKI